MVVDHLKDIKPQSWKRKQNKMHQFNYTLVHLLPWHPPFPFHPPGNIFITITAFTYNFQSNYHITALSSHVLKCKILSFILFFRSLSEIRTDLDRSWPWYSDLYRPLSTGYGVPQGPVLGNNAVSSGVSLYRGEWG